jgi:hypothetical protein
MATKKNHILRLKFADESVEQIGTIARSSPLKGLAYLGEDRFVLFVHYFLDRFLS